MKVRWLVILIVALLVRAAPAVAQRGVGPAADLSGVDQFWAIADRLQRGEEPGEAAWDSLFATPGYAALDARERRRPALETGIRLALDPRLITARDSTLREGSWTARVIRHVRDLPGRRHELDGLRRRLVREDFLSGAMAAAQTLLPPGTVRVNGVPPVSFVFFLPDGRGYPGLLVADLANIADKADPAGYFAHEAVHFYYARLAEEGRGPLPPHQESLLTLLAKLFEESLGDQLDKGSQLALDADAFARLPMTTGWRAYMEAYRANYRMAPDHLRAVDRALSAAAGSRVRLATVADSLRGHLPLEGRPIGFFVTRAIRDHLGDAHLAGTVGDPVAWILAYQEAARRPGCSCPPLSTDWLERLPAPLSAAVTAPGAIDFGAAVMVFLRRGPHWTDSDTPEHRALQARHAAYLLELADSGLITLAGPLSGDRADDDIRGVILVAHGSVERVKALLARDPKVSAGHLVAEVLTWYHPARHSHRIGGG